MHELGELEASHEEFEKRNARVVVVSLEDPEKAKQTQEQFPHLLVLSDAKRQLSEAVQVIHPQSDPEGGDTSAPTTVLLDGGGTVRWARRPERNIVRLTPAEVLAALDEHVLK